MYLEKNLEKKWLVKSENKILGPYNFDQIVDLIRKNQVSLIDEIRDPATRWLYVRENPEFKSIVEEMRIEIDARSESTKTLQNTASKSFDTTMLKTKTDFNQYTDISLEAQDITATNEVLTEPPKIQIPVEKARVYGVQNDEVVQKKLSLFSNKILIAVFASAIIVLSSFFGYIYIQKRNIIKQEEEWALQIKKYKYLGLYQKAADLFTKLPAANQKKLIPDLLEIYPLLEATGLVNPEDIKSIKSETGLSADQRANIEIINFWLAMAQQNYGQAQDYLIKAASLQPTSLIIKENQALLYLKKGQYLDSFNIFKTNFAQEKNGRYLLGMVQAYYGLPDAERSQFSKEILYALEKYTTVYYDYKKELLLAQIALAHELNEAVLYKVSKAQFFNTPSQFSNQFTRPILLALNTYAWKELNKIKENVQKTLLGDELILFQLHDYLEDNQLSVATEFISSNVSRVSSLAIGEQMKLLLYNAQKRSTDVLAIEKANQIDMNSELNHLIIALNKLELNPQEHIAGHLQFLNAHQQVFYKEWIELEQLIKKNAVPELKIYIKDHFVTVQNFAPVFVAKSLVN